MTRRAPARDRLDRYYTPDALAIACVGVLQMPEPRIVLEPSVGGGAFARAVRARWPNALLNGMDLDPDAAGGADVDHLWCRDFLQHGYAPQSFGLVIGNPPYKHAEAHVRAALALAPRVAFLLRLGFLASQDRAPLWRDHPPASVHVLSRRPSFTGKGTDAQEYALFVWDIAHRGEPAVRWLDWKPAKAVRVAA